MPEFDLKTIRFETIRTIKVGLPIVATQLVAMSMQFVDTVMAGNLSAEALAAVAIGGSLVAPMLVFVIGVLLAINPIVAHHHGGRRYEEIGRTLWQGIWLSLALAIPFFILMRTTEPVMQLFGIDPSMQIISSGYLEAYSWGIPAACGYFALRYFKEGLSITQPSMFIAFVGMVVNIFGNYTFMYGHFGFPAMGAIGTGLATAVVWWVMFFGFVIVVFRRSINERFAIFAGFRLPRKAYLMEIFRIGIPSGISFSLEVTMFAVTALIIGSLGVYPIAAHQITINFAATTFMIPLGLSIATTSRVGFAVGAEDWPKARLLGNIGIMLSLFVMSCTAVLMITVPDLIINMYTDEQQVHVIAVKLMVLAGIFQISDGLQVAATGALRGLKDTKLPMFVNLFAYWIVGIPMGYALGILSGLGTQGLWYGLIAGLTVAAIMHNLRFRYLMKAYVRHPEAAAASLPTEPML